MKPYIVAVCAILATTMPGCDLDEARNSGATKQHADDKKDQDDENWDEATGNEEPNEEGPCLMGVTVPSITCRDNLEALCRDQGGHPLVSGRVTCLFTLP
jgi:hypothetical protein